MLAYDGFGFEINKGSRVSWDLPSGETMTGIAAYVSENEEDDTSWLCIDGEDGKVYGLEVVEGECNEAGLI